MNPVRRRGRPRQFDPERALVAMRDVFWRVGFEATSLDMLCAAASMSRPSLYSAFGDKRTIYRSVVAAFTKEAESELYRSLNGPATLGDALTAFYSRAIDLYSNEKGGGGCLSLCTLTPIAAEDAEFSTILSEVIARMDAAIERRISRAVHEGEMSEDTPVAALTAACSAILQSLSIRARAKVDTSDLIRFVASVDELIIPWARS